VDTTEPVYVPSTGPDGTTGEGEGVFTGAGAGAVTGLEDFDGLVTGVDKSGAVAPGSVTEPEEPPPEVGDDAIGAGTCVAAGEGECETFAGVVGVALDDGAPKATGSEVAEEEELGTAVTAPEPTCQPIATTATQPNPAANADLERTTDPHTYLEKIPN
jgi:hypothetical protein